ncbi:MAG: CvpA family protein [Lachnospiraceae bacterium]|nr:CvpA family protein [Lachnospiraceae bacterium]
MNILLIIVLALLVFNVVTGYKKGFVKALVSFISLIVLGIVAVLVINGIHGYVEGDFLTVLIMVALLVVISVVHHVINFVLLPAKLLSKLPIVSWLNQLLGIVFGILQTLLMVWIVYAGVLLLDLGMVEQLIVTATQENEFLSWLYKNNYLLALMQMLLG